MIDRSLYLRFRASGMGAMYAAHAARTLATFQVLEDAGFVRVDARPDLDADLSFVEQDCYMSTREGRAVRVSILRSVERDGVWGTVGQYRVDPESDEWKSADSVWGHIGYRDLTDPFENWYVVDIMAETIRQLKELLRSRCPVCRRPAA